MLLDLERQGKYLQTRDSRRSEDHQCVDQDGRGGAGWQNSCYDELVDLPKTATDTQTLARAFQ
jgi:hypothetical protein